MKTPLSHFHQPTQTPAILTQVLDQVDVEEPLQQQLETNGLESPSYCTKPYGDAKLTIDIDLDAQSDVDTDPEEGSGINNIDVSDFKPLPNPSNEDTKSTCDLPTFNSCSLDQSKDLLHQHAMQQSKHFPLLWYFSTQSQQLIIDKRTQKSQQKRKARIPAKKLLYYTKEMGYYRQCFHPRFEYPHSCLDLLQCRGTDFLLVFVGLLNILLLQFVLVVLMFFSQEDINYHTLKHYDSKLL